MRNETTYFPGEYVMTAHGTVRPVAAVKADGMVLVWENGVPTAVRLYGERPTGSAVPHRRTSAQRRTKPLDFARDAA